MGEKARGTGGYSVISFKLGRRAREGVDRIPFVKERGGER